MIDLLAKYFSGNVSSEEKTQVEAWRNESEQNAAEFFEYATLWNEKTGELALNKQLALNNVLKKISDAESNESKVIPMQSSGLNWKSYLRYAAILVVGVGLAFYFYKNTNSGTRDQMASVVVTTDNGQLKEVVLPDGSTVSLSESSSLAYSNNFDGDIREVQLEGKAFFEIKRNERKPFVVRTEESEVRVLGTSFLVDTDAADHNTEVVVATGRVAVTKNTMKYKDNSSRVELTPGEIGTVSKSSRAITKNKNSNVNYLSWKTSIIDFDRENLKSVIQTLEEVYHINIEVSDPNIYNCKLSAKFDHRPVTSVMEIVSQTFGLELVKISAKEFQLNGKGCILAQ